MRQRGTVTLVQVLIVIGVVSTMIATAWGAIAWHAGVHFKRGELAKQAEWDKAKLRAIAAGLARDRDVSDAVKEQEDRRAAADARVAEADRRWKEARDANRNARLGACAPARAEGVVGADRESATATVGGLRPPASPGGDRAADPGVRLSWRLVGLHDGAFTGLDGEPLYRDSARFAIDPARADALSPYGLEQAVDVGGENAKALSSCRREYFTLRGKLVAAELAWDRRNRR